jgi:hypothetical protein
MSSRLYSRSSRSCTISECSSPRKPHRKPKPIAEDTCGAHTGHAIQSIITPWSVSSAPEGSRNCTGGALVTHAPAHSERKSSKTRGRSEQHLGLELQRGVVELQLAQRLPQVLVSVRVYGEQAAEHHGLRHLVPARARLTYSTELLCVDLGSDRAWPGCTPQRAVAALLAVCLSCQVVAWRVHEGAQLSNINIGLYPGSASTALFFLLVMVSPTRASATCLMAAEK